MSEQLRLDKYLSDMGIGTRSEIKIWIRKGRVTVNSEICKKPETKVLPGIDAVVFDSTVIVYSKYVYFMLNKPTGVVSATRDNVNETVIDLINPEDYMGKDIFPVGRLDKDTEGLLLLTNDGDFAHNLLSPKKHVNKVYYAKVLGRVSTKDVVAFLQGVQIEADYTTLPATLNIIKSDEISEIELTIQEGKFHQVKRMFEAVDKEVIYLKRISMGDVTLDDTLALGEYRSLTSEEIQLLTVNVKQ